MYFPKKITRSKQPISKPQTPGHTFDFVVLLGSFHDHWKNKVLNNIMD